MKAIQSGNTFRIYDNSMKTYDQLPPNAYLVNFSEKTGICAVLNFMAGNIFLGALDVLLVLLNGMLAGMNSDKW